MCARDDSRVACGASQAIVPGVHRRARYAVAWALPGSVAQRGWYRDHTFACLLVVMSVRSYGGRVCGVFVRRASQGGSGEGVSSECGTRARRSQYCGRLTRRATHGRRCWLCSWHTTPELRSGCLPLPPAVRGAWLHENPTHSDARCCGRGLLPLVVVCQYQQWRSSPRGKVSHRCGWHR